MTDAERIHKVTVALWARASSSGPMAFEAVVDDIWRCRVSSGDDGSTLCSIMRPANLVWTGIARRKIKAFYGYDFSRYPEQPPAWFTSDAKDNPEIGLSRMADLFERAEWRDLSQ